MSRVFKPDPRLLDSRLLKEVAVAKKKEEENRLKAYFPKGLYEPVLSISCHQPTLNTYYLLKCANSPFLDGKADITRTDCLSLLWIHSKNFTLGKLPPKLFSRKLLESFQEEEIISKVLDFWFSTFWDSDLLNNNHQKKKSSVPFKEKETGLLMDSFIDLFAHEYGWSSEEILTTPLRRLFLLNRKIKQRRLGKKYTPYNYSDFVRESLLKNGIN